MLYVTIADGGLISLSGCMSQFYFFGVSTVTECCLLTVMSYDRYLAICNPLRYSNIMDLKLCLHLAIWAWIIGFVVSLIITLFVYELEFCGTYIINHFFCDLAPLLKLSCSDTFIVEIQTTVVAVHIGVFQFIFIIITYIYIANAIHKISSTTGRQKAFSTCSSHLTVVCTYYGTLITTYMLPSKGQSIYMNKVLSLLYTVLTPLSNPIIYSFRSRELRIILNKVFNIKRQRREK
ncbi:olfactory receptor 5A2-like [Rhinophrynus dorsalis]